MVLARKKWEKQVCRKFWKILMTTQTVHFTSVFLRITLLSLIFLNFQTFGEGLNFCFDGTREGKFLKTFVLHVYALTTLRSSRCSSSSTQLSRKTYPNKFQNVKPPKIYQFFLDSKREAQELAIVASSRLFHGVDLNFLYYLSYVSMTIGFTHR